MFLLCREWKNDADQPLYRRMNVALTRARSSLFVLGDSVKLRSNQYWSNLVGDAEARGLLMTVSFKPRYRRLLF